MTFRTRIRPYAGSQPQALTPQQVAQLYSFPSATGASKTIGIISLGGGYSTADLQAAGVDPSRVTFVSVDGGSNAYSGNPNSADGENALDLQIIGGACTAKIRFYAAPNSDTGFVDALKRAAAECDAVSVSWGAPETAWGSSAETAMRAAINGSKPVFVASGDNGPDDGGSEPVADFPACAEHATACGGTKLIASGSTIASETDWNDSAIGGGEEGYGVSRVVPAPSWQHMGQFRVIPDIVLDAAPETGYGIHINGGLYVFGGTSAAAPMAAAGYARLSEALGSATPADFNAAIYGAPTAFNAVQVDPGDPISCVGLGSPNLSKLVAALTPSQPTPPPSNPPSETQTVNAEFTACYEEIDTASVKDPRNASWYATGKMWGQQFYQPNIDGVLTQNARDAVTVSEPEPVPAPPEGWPAKEGA